MSDKLNTNLVFSLFLLVAGALLVSADGVNTSCDDYCENSVFYTRGGYNAPSQSCAYLTIQCSQGCNPETGMCRPEPPRTCDSYCSDGVYRYNGTLVRGLCRYSRITCEYGCNAENLTCAAPLSSTVGTVQNSSTSNVSSQNATLPIVNITQQNSTPQVTNVTQVVQTYNTTLVRPQTQQQINESIRAVEVDETEAEPQARGYGEERRVEPLDPVMAAGCLAGCKDQNNICVPIGIRTSGRYCDIDRQLKAQSASGLTCNNGYECESNICADGKCSTVGFLQKLINFFNLLLQILGIDEKTQNAGSVEASDGASLVQQVEQPQVQVSPSFNVADNTVELAIDGIGGFDAVIISGPALELERVAGFRLGIRDDNPGRTTPYPLVFEYEGPAEASLENYFESVKQNAGNSKPLVMKIKDLSGEERVWWNYTQYVPTSIQTGTYKNKRYTFARVPGTTFKIGDAGTFQMDRRVKSSSARGLSRGFPEEVSKNPEADTKIEISGVTSYVYPVVEVNESTQTIVLTFDYVEGGGIWQWVLNIASGFEDKKSMSIILEDPAEHGSELNRTNYFDVWPYKYEQFTGYNQVDKVKERVYIAYSKREQG